MQKSTSLKYEPSSEPLHIFIMELFSDRDLWPRIIRQLFGHAHANKALIQRIISLVGLDDLNTLALHASGLGISTRDVFEGERCPLWTF